MSLKQLQEQATAILRANGFTAGGRPKNKVSGKQLSFEHRILTTPIGGQPGYKLHSKYR